MARRDIGGQRQIELAETTGRAPLAKEHAEARDRRVRRTRTGRC
jgi:hypothetical protein